MRTAARFLKPKKATPTKARRDRYEKTILYYVERTIKGTVKSEPYSRAQVVRIPESQDTPIRLRKRSSLMMTKRARWTEQGLKGMDIEPSSLGSMSPGHPVRFFAVAKV